MLTLRVFAVAVLLAFSVSLSAQQPGAHADANPTAENEIKALELKLADEIVRSDWDKYAKHLGSDYLHTRENGQVENKEQALASLGDIRRKTIVMELEPEDLVIHIYGDTAVSSAKFAVTVREAGQVKNRFARLTYVFVKREGQWFLVAEQGTTIGK
jgi:ketosteroid isomerase-like protein